MVDDPLCKLIPLVALSSVDADAPFAVLNNSVRRAIMITTCISYLILALLKIRHDLYKRDYCCV